jgi:hypothetical protein
VGLPLSVTCVQQNVPYDATTKLFSRAFGFWYPSRLFTGIQLTKPKQAVDEHDKCCRTPIHQQGTR